LTGNKAVLRAAVERLKRGGSALRDTDRPPMSAYLAYLIEERRDSAVLSAYVDQMVRETKLDPAVAERMVKARARALLTRSDVTNRNVMMALLTMMRSAAHYPGRKLAYFFSDGFVPNIGGSDFGDMVRRVSDAAARAGVVLYSVDARGLSTGGLVDAAREDFVDTSGRIASAQMRELSDTQEPLHSLAAATGGRAFVNSNSLDEGLARAVQETTRYYLLAWRPEGADPRDKGFRKLQVKVLGRPDLKVLVRSGFFGTSSPEEEEREARVAKGAKPEKGAAPAAQTVDELVSALTALSAQRALPVSMSLGYEQARAGGSLLTASIQIDAAALDYGASGAPPQPAKADVACAVFDTSGKSVGTFRQHLQVPPPGPESKRVTLKNEAPLGPGLYQVRVAARDARSLKVGSAIDWVEVPEFVTGAFSLSSIYLAESPQGAGPGEAFVNFERRFAHTSRLGFRVHIYNAARAASSPPDVTMKVEVLRGKEAALPATEAAVAADKAPDASRFDYIGDFDLGSLAPGRYVHQLTAIDRASKATATRQIDFMVL
jgi:VWFA-related protein